MTQLVNKLFSTHLIYLYVLNGWLTCVIQKTCFLTFGILVLR